MSTSASRAPDRPLTDALGSTVGLASGVSVQTHYGYDPYGVAQTTGVASTNPYQFTGRENDQTAAGLMYYRARYYNPTWGRFIAEDPIGIAGGTNLYAYGDGSPERFTDPFGHSPRQGEPWAVIQVDPGRWRFFDGNGNADFDIEFPGDHCPGWAWHGSNGTRGDENAF